jgi:hypothetical protein
LCPRRRDCRDRRRIAIPNGRHNGRGGRNLGLASLSGPVVTATEAILFISSLYRREHPSGLSRFVDEGLLGLLRPRLGD